MTAPQQDTTEILELLGYSIHHERVQQMLRDFELEAVLPEKKERKTGGLMGLLFGTPPPPIPPTSITQYKNPRQGIFLKFQEKQFFVQNYAGIKYEDNPHNPDELILENFFYHPKGPHMILPFGLSWPTSGEQLQYLFGQPQHPWTREGETHWNYLIDGYKVFFRLDQQNQLVKMDATLCDLMTHHKIQRENMTEEENQFLQPDKIQDILRWKKQKPSTRWRGYEIERREELEVEEINSEEETFHQEELAFISAADQVFDQFVEKVVKYTFAKDAIGMYEGLKETIFEFNRLDGMRSGGIDTMEREGICGFLKSVLETSGFRLYEHEHITDPWREW